MLSVRSAPSNLAQKKVNPILHLAEIDSPAIWIQKHPARLPSNGPLLVAGHCNTRRPQVRALQALISIVSDANLDTQEDR